MQRTGRTQGLRAPAHHQAVRCDEEPLQGRGLTNRLVEDRCSGHCIRAVVAMALSWVLWLWRWSTVCRLAPLRLPIPCTTLFSASVAMMQQKAWVRGPLTLPLLISRLLMPAVIWLRSWVLSADGMLRGRLWHSLRKGQESSW